MKSSAVLLVVGSLLLLASCGNPGGQSDQNRDLTIQVDTSLAPAQPSLPDDSGNPRPLARVQGQSGVAVDIVLGELLVITNDQQKLQSFLSRWGGRVIQSYPYPEVQQVPGLRAYHVRINPSTAQVEAILRELNRQVPELEGSLRTSSQEAAQLLAVALSEARREGMTVMPNLVGQNQAEAPTGEQGYNPNPITWSYMASGTPQNIGVDRAWDELRRVGRLDLPLEERVRIAILDGGFAPNQDFPPGLENFAPLNTRNPATCSGGTPCPWHGTHVLTTAMGVPNNDFGVAGPAGSVARPITIGVRPEVTEIFRIPQILSGLAQARIINMSFSINIPWEVDFAFEMACRASCGPFAPFCHCPSLSGTLSSVSGFLAGAGWLLFASAGNDGRDVDQGGAPFNNEGFTRVPCELAGVICVGGMAENSTRRDPYSAFGSKRDGDSVDIYGPFTVWTGPDPDDNRNRARKQMGTSFSSPFVAGVAALVWAANPALSAGQVWEILRDTAHNCDLGPEVTGHRRCVNAYGAVLRALERSEDFYLHVVTTDPRGSRADLNREWQLLAEVRSMDGRRICEGCPIRLDPPPSRTAGSLRYYRFNTEGRKTITITATDPRNRTHTRRVEVQVVNTPPQVSLLLPNDGDVFATNTDVDFEGRALDLNEGPDPGPGPIECRWRSSNPADPIHNRVGCRHTLRFPSSGNRVITLSATDPQGLTSSKSVRVSVLDFPNQPPAVTMGPLTPEPTYSGGSGVGYASNQRLRATASATDPEGDLPITYTWRVTSYRPDPDPNDGTEPEVWARAVISTRTDTGDLDWIPENTSPRVIGDWRDFPRDCMMGQKVVLQLEVTDSRGNLSRRSLPPFIVYNRSCLLN